MIVRNAEEKDIGRLLELLTQVQAIHVQGRPDLFAGENTKYRAEDLRAILQDASRPVFVAVDGADVVQGYAFCICQQPNGESSLQPRKALYIDDLCVDQVRRGEHIGRALYEHVRETAQTSGCYHVTLNVWSLNQTAARFYEKMGLKPLKVTMEALL